MARGGHTHTSASLVTFVALPSLPNLPNLPNVPKLPHPPRFPCHILVPYARKGSVANLFGRVFQGNLVRSLDPEVSVREANAEANPLGPSPQLALGVPAAKFGPRPSWATGGDSRGVEGNRRRAGTGE